MICWDRIGSREAPSSILQMASGADKSKVMIVMYHEEFEVVSERQLVDLVPDRAERGNCVMFLLSLVLLLMMMLLFPDARSSSHFSRRPRSKPFARELPSQSNKYNDRVYRFGTLFNPPLS